MYLREQCRSLSVHGAFRGKERAKKQFHSVNHRPVGMAGELRPLAPETNRSSLDVLGEL